jgi:SAM-dependent methyltransferase
LGRIRDLCASKVLDLPGLVDAIENHSDESQGIAMSTPRMFKHQGDWEDLAQLDPLFAILTAEGKEFGKWDSDEFFASGKAEIDSLMTRCGIKIGDNGKALDFGCGVGRLSRALSSYFGEVHGVDISPEMVRLASQFTPGCKFLVNDSTDLKVFRNDSFDFIYCNIVLQHQPDEETAKSYIAEFVRIIKPAGIAVFQIPCKLALRTTLQPKRRLYSLLRSVGISADFIYKRLRLDPMRTIAVSSNDVRATVSAQGGRIVNSYRDHYIRNSMTYVVAKP